MPSNVEKVWSTKAGLTAVVLMTDLGHRCGYVGIPSTHPLFGVEYSQEAACLKDLPEDEPVGGRGIITLFCMPTTADGKISRRPDAIFDVHGSLTYSGGSETYPIESKGLWWFGYDCGHSGDAPAPGSRMAEYSVFPGDIHRTLEFCIEQCESLAQQLIDRVEGAVR
jgi:hypothetical protein